MPKHYLTYSWMIEAYGYEYCVSIYSNGVCVFFNEKKYRQSHSLQDQLFSSANSRKKYMTARKLSFDEYVAIRDILKHVDANGITCLEQESEASLNTILINVMRIPPTKPLEELLEGIPDDEVQAEPV